MLSKLKQFKDLRDQGKKMQGLMKDVSATGTGAGNKVVLIMDGNFSISGLTIDPELLTPDNKSKLEEGIKAAHSDAMRKIQKQMMTKMQESGDMKLPGMS